MIFQTGFFVTTLKFLLLISNLLNSSNNKRDLPSLWKQAIITPIQKEKHVKDTNKNIRPISLTPALSKLAADIEVENYIAPVILTVIDPKQFGSIPRSCGIKGLHL